MFILTEKGDKNENKTTKGWRHGYSATTINADTTQRTGKTVVQKQINERNYTTLADRIGRKTVETT